MVCFENTFTRMISSLKYNCPLPPQVLTLSCCWSQASMQGQAKQETGSPYSHQMWVSVNLLTYGNCGLSFTIWESNISAQKMFISREASPIFPNLYCVFMCKKAKFPPKFQKFPPHINISWEWASQIPHFFSPCISVKSEFYLYGEIALVIVSYSCMLSV